MKKLFWVIGAGVLLTGFLVYWFFFRTSHEAYKLVPSNALMVLRANPYQMSKQLDFKAIQASPMFKNNVGKMGDDRRIIMTQLMENPEDAGLDLMSDVNVNLFDDAGEMVTMVAFGVSDEEKLRTLMNKVAKKEGEEPVIFRDDIYYFGMGNKEGLSSLLFWKGNKGAYLSGDYDEAVNWRKRVKALLNQTEENSILGLDDFKDHLSENADLSFYINPKSISESRMGQRSMLSYGLLGSQLKDMSMGIQVNFEKEEIEGEMQYYFKNKEAQEKMKITENPGEFGEWMKGCIPSNSLFFTTISLNFEKYLALLKSNLGKDIDINQWLSQLGMTEKDLNTIGLSKMVLSFHGMEMRMEKKMVEEYNYLNHEFYEREKEIPVIIPYISLAMACKSTSKLEEFAKKSMQGTAQGGYYLPISSGLNIWMAFKNNKIYITTREEELKQLQNSGKFSASYQGKMEKHVTKDAGTMYLNMNFKSWPENTKKAIEESAGDRTIFTLTQVTRNLEQLTIRGNSEKAKFQLSMNGNEKSSLMTIFKMMEDVYMQSQK